MASNDKPIPIIINPASGKPRPVLHAISQSFRAHGLTWRGHLTYEFGDATRIAREVVADGAELVAVFGGDGTVLEVVNGVMGSGATIAILPGGTGNAVATELGISREIEEAVELLCTSPNRRAVDVAQCNDSFYMLRAYFGISPEQAASRELKDQYHLLAYPMAVMNVLRNAPQARYRVTVDNQVLEAEAMTCFVNNLDNMGGVDISIGTIQPDDGMVDVMLVSLSHSAVGEVAKYILRLGETRTHAYHAQGRKVTVETDPPQTVWLDGELRGMTPVTIQVHRGAVKVVVP
jgi:YegS/Rv2252/BmrU family lipid kinase